MYVVVFRAKTQRIDQEYRDIAEQMRKLALEEHGCLDFVSVNQNGLEVSLSYWPGPEHIMRWKRQSDHIMAQRLGAKRWYASYTVEIATIERQYSHTVA